MEKIISRLAPSPSGYLHLGNAWSFVMCWLITRSRQGELILRIDDLDPDRSRPHFTEAIVEDLRWLGLDWDKGHGIAKDGGNWKQSGRLALYRTALESLREKGFVYPCFCKRREMRLLANAPHMGEEGAYPVCPCASMPQEEATGKILAGENYALKLRTASASISFTDLLYGQLEYGPSVYGGDFALQRSDGVFAYQLASALDDALMGVNLVIRGNDLLTSCPRQILILQKLKHSAPRYAHLPLILDQKGDRLAKRHASLTIRSLREKGVKAEELLGLFAYWAGIQDSMTPLNLGMALKKFALSKLPKDNIRLPDSPLFA